MEASVKEGRETKKGTTAPMPTESRRGMGKLRHMLEIEQPRLSESLLSTSGSKVVAQKSLPPWGKHIEKP